MTFKPKHTTLFILFLVVSTLSLAQVKTTIRGNVVDEKGAPIFAASIYLNNSQGTFSEEDGTFQLSNVVPGSYNLTASFVGLVMGGIQSLSRSTYSKLLPETNDSTSFFSFYDVAEKIGIVIGMGIFASIDQISGSMRNAIVFLALFFIVGVILLINVQKTINRI